MCAPTEIPVGAIVPFDGGATCGALTTTFLSGVDPTGFVGGPECVHSEDVLNSPAPTFLLTLRSITPSTAVDYNASSVVASIGWRRGALF